jgi:hypothetical protein
VFVKVTLIGLGLAVRLLAGCDRAEPGRGPGFDLEAQAAAVEHDRRALAAARRELDAARPAGPELPPQPPLVATREEFDRAFAVYQRRLVFFLNIALNEYPRAAATRRALELYADEAVRWAQEVERRGGDMSAARRRLREVMANFEAIDAPVPPALVRAAGP